MAKLALLLCMSLYSYAQQTPPGIEWLRSIETSSGSITSNQMKSDASGNFYIVGQFNGTVDFDPGTGTFPMSSTGTSSNNDVFVLKLDPTGKFAWAKKLDGTGNDNATDISFDAAGNLYLGGTFNGTIDLDPGPGSRPATAQTASNPSAFVLKLDPSGNYAWARTLGDNTSSAVTVTSVYSDASGNLSVYGRYVGTVDFDPLNGSYPLASSGNYDEYILKLNLTGGFFVSAGRLGGPGAEGPGRHYVDGSGNQYLTGSYFGTVDFNPGSGTFDMTSNGASDAFVVKLDINSNFVWAKGFGGVTADQAMDIKTDAAGNMYLIGTFTGTADLDPGAGIFELTSNGQADIFVVKLEASGNFLWAKGIGGDLAEVASAVQVDAGGNVYITGGFGSTVDFNPGPGTSELTSNSSSNDAFVLKLNQSGEFDWVKSLGSSALDYGVNLSADSGGNVYLAGNNGGTLDWGCGSMSKGSFLVKLTGEALPEGFTVSPNTLSPLTQSACTLGIPATIQGSLVGVSTPAGDDRTLIYQWQTATSASGPWEDMPGEVFAELQPLASSVTRYYRRLVKATDAYCQLQVVSTSQAATVETRPDVAPTVNADGPQWFVCGPGSNTVTLNGSAQGGTGSYSYQWYQGSTNFGTPLAANALLTTPAVTEATTFTLQVTDGAGCTDLDQVTIVPATANAGADQSICQGADGTQIGVPPVAAPAVSYNWTSISGSPVSTLSCTTCAQPIANPAVTTVYRVTVSVQQKNGAICTTIDDVTVTPVTAPNNTLSFAGTDKTICKNTQVTLGGTADNTFAYVWTSGQYLNDSQVANPVFSAGTAAVTGGAINYTVTAIKSGCTFTDEIKVSVINSRITDQNQTVCGPAWSYHIDEDNALGTAYSWNVVSGDGVVLQTSGNGKNAYLKSNNGVTTFRRTAALNGVSCTADIMVQPCTGNTCNFEILTLSDQECPKVFPGSVLKLGTSVPNPADFNFQWSPANLVDNSRASSVTITSTTQATVTVTITNKYDASVSCSESIVVNPPNWAKPEFTFEDKYTCPGVAVQIGGPDVAGFSYAWTPVTGLSDPNIAGPTATLSQTSDFLIKIKENVSGCATSDTVTVHVTGPVAADAGTDRAVCNGATITLGTPAPAGANWVYSWDPVNAAWTNGTGPSDAQPQVQFAASEQIFTLTVTDPVSGCSATDQVVLRNSIQQGEYAGSPVSTCQGAPVQLGRSPEPGAQYEWFMADGVTPATGLSSNTVANPTMLNPTATTTFVVKVSYPGCTTPASDQVTVTVNPVQGLTLADKPVCPTGPIAIGYGSNGNPVAPAGASYQWAPATGLSSASVANPTATITSETTYTVTVTLSSGCIFTDQVTVTPTADAGPDATLCSGQSAQIGSPAIAGATYSWAGTGIVGASNVAQPTVRPTVTTTYTVSVTLNGCTATDQVTVTVNTPAGFAITGNTAICEGGVATLSLAGTPDAHTTWQWSPVAGVASPNSTSTTIAATSTQTYRLTQTNLNTGCSNYKEVVVVVNPNTIAATAGEVALCDGASAPLPLNVTSSGSYAYVWAPSVGLSNAYIANPTVTTGSPRIYTVTVTDNASQCQLVRQVNVFINEPEACFASVTLTGNVFHDANALKDVTVNATSVDPIPTDLYVTLVNDAGTAIRTVPVNANGAYDFGVTPPGDYNIVLHQTATGSTTPSIPTGWINTGEYLGAGVGSDDAVNGILTGVTVAGENVTNANFGIQQPPVADPKDYLIDQPTPDQIITLNGTHVSTGTGTASPDQLTGADPEDGALNGAGKDRTVVITKLPDNGELYYNGALVTEGQVIPGYDPAQMTVKLPGTGYISSTFEYAYMDQGGEQSPSVPYKIRWDKPLPVTLVSFTAIARENAAELSWVTSEEIGADRFEIQRSIDGKTWKAIGIVKAEGESKVRKPYSFIDHQPEVGTSFYRLKMIDRAANHLDGAFTFSAVRSVRYETKLESSIYPNPVSGLLNLKVTNWTLIKSVRINNLSGLQVYSSTAIGSGFIDVSGLDTGTFILHITYKDGSVHTHKFVHIR